MKAPREERPILALISVETEVSRMCRGCVADVYMSQDSLVVEGDVYVEACHGTAVLIWNVRLNLVCPQI